MKSQKKIPLLLGCLSVVLCAADGRAADDKISSVIDGYVTPYAQSSNFSGDVLVKKDGKIIFHKAYGFADRESKTPNTSSTRFHIASMSMQFTAGAILRLVDQKVIGLDDPVGNLVPNTSGADKITIRDLLTERSGLPDINELPEYDALLQQHQTPASLVAKIGGPLLFKPGSQFLHEEHSAYNLLALIIEKKTGLPFATALNRLLFQPLHLDGSSADDDSTTATKEIAHGYKPVGVDDLAPAPVIRWSAKTGNASICTTAEDEARWVEALFHGDILSDASKSAMLDESQRVGYGWFKGASKRFEEPAYYMNGRAPGFASFVLYLPRESLTVVVFSNIYSSATTDIGYDIASIALGRAHASFQPGKALSAADLKRCLGTFQFGSDFYQKDARVELTVTGSDLFLHWPSGELSPLIPMSPDHFIDRNYWEPVTIERDVAGAPGVLIYDRFRGPAVKAK